MAMTGMKGMTGMTGMTGIVATVEACTVEFAWVVWAPATIVLRRFVGCEGVVARWFE